MPAVVYALASNRIFVSFDAGVKWTQDTGTLPPSIGSGTGHRQCDQRAGHGRVAALLARGASHGEREPAPPAVWRGDYSQFAGTATIGVAIVAVPPNLEASR